MKLDDIVNEFSFTNRRTEKKAISEDMVALIHAAKINIQRFSTTPESKKIINEQIAKLDSLQPLLIPMKDNIPKTYFTISDSAGGVTEKTCLIDKASLMDTLHALTKAESYQDVMKSKVQMNAILKHPKAGKYTEIQREGIGLHIARLLGFENVTQSTLVLHNTGSDSIPCLFVPFEKIEMLTDSMENYESMSGRLKQERFKDIEDFGKYSAFFMLCSDPDFIGKQGQNKGLIEKNGSKKLYVFDQVFMTNNNLGFDKALNLIPTSLLAKLPSPIARHFIGRNRSVINDSSYEEKIKGVLHLLSKQQSIRTLLQEVAKANEKFSSHPVVSQLKEDAHACLKSYDTRMQHLKNFFPPINVEGKNRSMDKLLQQNEEKTLNLVCKALLLNQLMNKPKLFDEAGKPYKSPFFSTTHTKVEQISFKGEEVTITLGRKFSPPLSNDKKALLIAQGFTLSSDGKSVTISAKNLENIDEFHFFKEQQSEIDLDHNYIERKKIINLAKTYSAIPEEITNVLILIKKTSTSLNRLQTLEDSITKLNDLMKNQPNLGFLQHVKQCFLYEATREIIKKNPEQAQDIQRSFSEHKNAGTLPNFVTNVFTAEKQQAIKNKMRDLREETPDSELKLR